MSNIVYVVYSSFGEWEDYRKSISGIFTDILLAEQYSEEIDSKYKILKESGEPGEPGEPGELTIDMMNSMTEEQIKEWEDCWDNYQKAEEYNRSWFEPIELNTKLL